MTSMRDVARQAGVSTATVSRVINRQTGVGAQTRSRVQTVVDATGYRPNRLASSLSRQKSNLVAVLLGNLKSPFATTLHASVESALRREGFQAISCCTRSQVERERKYVRALIEMKVAGAIIRPSNSVSETVKNARLLNRYGIPTVYIDLLPGRKSDNYVVCDNLAGGRLGMEYLIARGHRHIGIVTNRSDSDPQRERAGNLRMRGILDVAREHDLSASVYTAPPADLIRYDLGYWTAEALLRAHPEITALFSLTDTAAIGALHAVNDLGLRVPEDVSVLGYDGIPMGSVLVPPLTTIVQPIARMGARAARLLVEHTHSPTATYQQVVLPISLADRRSVALPRATGSLSL